MAKHRRHFTRQMKKEIVEALNSNKFTIEQIEKRWSVSRYQVFKWRDQLVAQAVEMGASPLGLINSSSNFNMFNMGDARDQTITQLKLKLSELMMINDELKAQLASKKQNKAARDRSHSY